MNNPAFFFIHSLKITQKLAALLIFKLEDQIISIVPFTDKILFLPGSINDDVIMFTQSR